MGMNPFYDTPTPEREKGDGAQCKDGEGDANHHIDRHDQRLPSGLTEPYYMDTSRYKHGHEIHRTGVPAYMSEEDHIS